MRRTGIARSSTVGSTVRSRVEEMEKAKKENLKKQKNQKKKAKKPQPEDKEKETQSHSTPHKDPLPETYDTEDALVGYGTNAMIYNNSLGESESSEDEGIEDYKIGGYHPVHVGYSFPT